MSLHLDLRSVLKTDGIGNDIYTLAAELYPICRSITGDGVRATLRLISEHIGLSLHEVPTGTAVFDWTVPREWNVRGAHIRDSRGRTIVDFADSNLHVVSYSTPVRKTMSLAALSKHLHTLPEQPDAIPYRTSYYADDWGFCLPHRLFLSLAEDNYDVMIDASLTDGSLTYGEYVHRGETEDEFLLSAHVCHPSLANDNCAGVALLATLAKRLIGVKTRLSYRFVFAPGTIGAITWLARNEDIVHRITSGLVVSMVGDSGGPNYKRSRRGDAKIDRAVAHVLRHSGLPAKTHAFSPYGYDERQYCSPGFNLPVGLFQRSMYGSIPQYHTSADDLSIITPFSLGESYGLIVDAVDVIENDDVFINTLPKGEPQLGKRGLYASSIGGAATAAVSNMALLWTLNLSDGEASLLDIAERADLPFSLISSAARRLEATGILIRAE
jgi:aminopeptidase-like protein